MNPTTSDLARPRTARDDGAIGGKHTGTVKWFSRLKGYGFIDMDGTEVFVHYSAIEGEWHRNLYEGQKVEFTLGDRGRGPIALDVKPLSEF